MSYIESSTICAQASAQGAGAVSIIRLSGAESVNILDKVFKGTAPSLSEARSHRMKYGTIVNPDSGDVIDEVLVAVFRAPHSYTGEESAEIYCHGSDYIVGETLKLLLRCGAVMAKPGEFTQRAFLNGKLDLAQAEAVADLIAAQTRSAHDVALSQMKGKFSDELKEMRSELVDIVSLMELELDFSEEDVEFADRSRLKELLDKVRKHISGLIESFSLGNVIKNGVPVAIVGATNTGKSTLLNVLLEEERAIVSDIPGTTRDVIEDTMNIEGVTFRFIDTAGIRNTTETIEMIGIERTYSKMRQAKVVMLMLDALREDEFKVSVANFAEHLGGNVSVSEKRVVILLNKADLVSEAKSEKYLSIISESAIACGVKPLAVMSPFRPPTPSMS